jgi:WD40 repeat protein
MNFDKLYSLTQDKLFTDLSLILIDPSNNHITIDVNKNILYASCIYFEKLLTNFKEKNSNGITIEVSNAYVMYDIIMTFYNQKTNSGNISADKHLLESIICYNFLGFDFEEFLLDYIEVSEENFELFLLVIDLVGYNDKTIGLINKNIPKNYDLSKLSSELLSEMLSLEKSYCIVSGCQDYCIRIWNEKSKLIKTLVGHTDYISCICCSFDNKYIASSGKDQTIIIWDAVTGDLIKTIDAHHMDVCCICYSHDGQRIASGSADCDIKIWDADTYDLVHTFVGKKSSVMSLCYSLDSTRLVSGDQDGHIKIWNMITHEIILDLVCHGGPVTTICYSPDDRYIISGSGDRTIKIWTAITLTYVKELRDHWSGACYSSDNKWFASGTPNNNIQIRDTEYYRTTSCLSYGDFACCVCFSPDNKHIISGHWGKINIWDIETRKIINSMEDYLQNMSVICLLNYNTELAERIIEALKKIDYYY